jgi:hypothetical protein
MTNLACKGTYVFRHVDCCLMCHSISSELFRLNKSTQYKQIHRYNKMVIMFSDDML